MKIRKIIIFFIFIIISYVIYDIYNENTIKNYETLNQNNILIERQIEDNILTEIQVKDSNKEKDLKLIPKTYKGYKVSAKLKIEKLKIDTYVLEEYSKSSMEISVAKYFGPNPNEVGNYCIAGHNYIRKNMFSELKKLNIGDQLILTDNFHGSVCYEIYDKYKVTPIETAVLSQKTNGKKQVTLITCSDYSKKRIIIKAIEKAK